MKESSRIWNELNMAKQYTANIAKYTSRQRHINEIIDVTIVSLSIISIGGYYFYKWIPIIGVIMGLVWKYAKKLIPFFATKKAVDTLSFKDIFRYANKHSLLGEKAVERWFEYRDNRNNTAHDYGVEFAQKTLTLIDGFLADVEKLKTIIENE